MISFKAGKKDLCIKVISGVTNDRNIFPTNITFGHKMLKNKKWQTSNNFNF